MKEKIIEEGGGGSSFDGSRLKIWILTVDGYM